MSETSGNIVGLNFMQSGSSKLIHRPDMDVGYLDLRLDFRTID
jgi:hypothetical protein